jgi:hypothetical protein
MVNSEELIGTTEYLILYTGCRINQCRYKRVRLCIFSTGNQLLLTKLVNNTNTIELGYNVVTGT